MLSKTSDASWPSAASPSPKYLTNSDLRTGRVGGAANASSAIEMTMYRTASFPDDVLRNASSRALGVIDSGGRSGTKSGFRHVSSVTSSIQARIRPITYMHRGRPPPAYGVCAGGSISWEVMLRNDPKFPYFARVIRVAVSPTLTVLSTSWSSLVSTSISSFTVFSGPNIAPKGFVPPIL